MLFDGEEEEEVVVGFVGAGRKEGEREMGAKGARGRRRVSREVGEGDVDELLL